MKISVGILIFLAYLFLGFKTPQTLPSWVPAPAEQDFRWSPRGIKALSLGYLPILVDWFWLKVIVDPSMHPTPEGTHPPLYYDIDFITRADPKNQEAYIAGGSLLSILRRDFDGAKDILTRGHIFATQELPNYSAEFRSAHWSNPVLISISLIYLYLFELQDIPSAAKIIREMSNQPDTPLFITQMKTRLEKEGGEYEVGLRLLNFQIQLEQNAKIREIYISKRKNLFLGQFLFELNQQFAAYIDSYGQHKSVLKLQKGEIQQLWTHFKKEKKPPLEDPFGGAVFLSSSGRVTSSTPYTPVFLLK